MTENLYETNQFTNHTNGNYLFQHSPSALSASHYGLPNMSSIQTSPRLNQEHLMSPGTPGHELSPMLDSAGSWEYNPCGRTPSWGSSSHEDLQETSRIYPFNVASQNNPLMICKDNPQRLDSFSKAFPTKNVHLFFGEMSRDEKMSEIFTQSHSGGLERQSVESPVFNQQLMCDQSNFNMSESLYQNHQQLHYGYQQKQKANNMEQVNRNLHKSSWHPSHGYQSHPMAYQMALGQQQRGMFANKTHLDSWESLESPSYEHRQDFKVPEQQIFHYQDQQQHLRSLSQNANPYLQSPDQPVEQNSMFGDARNSAPNTPVFSSPNKDQSGFSFRSDDLYQGKSSAVCKAPPQTGVRGDVLKHFTQRASQWSKASSPDVKDEAASPHFRADAGLSRDEGSYAKMKCTVCLREFKSLPALNGHMRSHGGLRTHPANLKMRDGQMNMCAEVPQGNPIILPVSVPVKNYQTQTKLTLLCQQKDDGLIKSGAQTPLPPLRNHPSCIKRSNSEGESAPKQVKKKYRHCLVPLMIPSPSAGQESRGAVLFRSQLRTASSMSDDAPYTPPPMLSPARPGSGLFSAVSGRANIQSTPERLLSRAGEMDDCGETLKETAINVTPRINIGEEFQAKIPNIKGQSLTEEDSHNAVLLWSQTKDMESPDNQHKVDNLLKMACSSVLPGGGANTEYVLHCLFECRGDIMNTVEKLLLPTLIRHTSNLKTDYHYAGSDRWTLQEKRQLNKALLLHHKDFYLVQKMVKTKSVAQCVEYYYTWKKRLRLCSRVSTALATPVQDVRGDWATNNHSEPKKESISKSRDSENSSAAFVCETNEETWTQNNLRLLCSSPAEHRPFALTETLGSASVRSSPSNSTTSGDTDLALVFPCTECGKVFLKVKSRNAHMKTHRQQEETLLWHFTGVPKQDHAIVTPGCPVTPLKEPIRLHSLSYHSNTEAKTSLNDMCSESEQEMDCSLKSLPVLQSRLNFMSS